MLFIIIYVKCVLNMSEDVYLKIKRYFTIFTRCVSNIYDSCVSNIYTWCVNNIYDSCVTNIFTWCVSNIQEWLINSHELILKSKQARFWPVDETRLWSILYSWPPYYFIIVLWYTWYRKMLERGVHICYARKDNNPWLI